MTSDTNHNLDVIDRLRSLGEAAEEMVEPVAPEAILVERVPAVESQRRRRTVLVGAAAAVAALIGLGFGASTLLTMDTADPVVVAAAPEGTSAQAVDEGASPAQTEDLSQEPAGPSQLEIRADWEALRQCESSGDYRTNTGNGFYGAYQFDVNAWQSVGGHPGEFASDAPPIIQDERALLLFHRRGSEPWPICGRHLTEAATSPVVPGWLEAAVPVSDFNVFLEPTASASDIRQVETLVRDSQLVERWFPGATVSFVDKDAAYEEFKSLFKDSPELVESVTPDLLPASFRVRLPGVSVQATERPSLDRVVSELLAQLRTDSAVRRVVEGSEVLGQREDAAGKLFFSSGVRLQVERFGGTSEFRQVQRLSLLEVLFDLRLETFDSQIDLVGYVLDGDRLVIAGHSTDRSDPFFELRNLVPGDRLSLSSQDYLGQASSEWVVESSEIVDAFTAPLPPGGALVLTTEGDDPETRRVVIARLAVVVREAEHEPIRVGE